ncbi:hypothetical protein [Micromonospora haikouensis]|uniref:hypothetical protein n=1 Tax=Micromonospora haikouensis TaxID=686309 RepID=UPI003D71CEE3
MSALDDAAVAQLFGAHRYRYVNELELHDCLDEVLRAAGVVADREVRLTARERIDFLLPSGLGVEVKVAGSPGAVHRQMARYAAQPSIRALLLVTTRPTHLQGLPAGIGGVPVLSVLLRGGI